MFCLLRAGNCDIIQMICDISTPIFYLLICVTTVIHLIINDRTSTFNKEVTKRTKPKDNDSECL